MLTVENSYPYFVKEDKRMLMRQMLPYWRGGVEVVLANREQHWVCGHEMENLSE
jgi:hypothetical protein